MRTSRYAGENEDMQNPLQMLGTADAILRNHEEYENDEGKTV